jgi:hypothetical protein
MAGSGISSWQERLTARLKAEPKRAAMLAVLVAMMGLMWVKALTRSGMSPSGASASMDSAAYAAPAGDADLKPRLSRSSQALQEWARTPLPLVHRNLFDVKLEYFPQDGLASRQAGPDDASGFWDQVAKSLSNRADQEKARRILAENLRAQAARLNLESTVMSNGSPKALIDGVLVAEGDVVSGFRVLKIEAKRVIVEREGVRLEVLFNFR